MHNTGNQQRVPAPQLLCLPGEVDVLTSSLITLNDLIRHKVKGLQQQHAARQSILHHHHQQQQQQQQQHRGLESDSADLMGLSVQQSELLLMPGKADPLGMSDLAFLERGQQAHHTAESGSMHELQQQQQPITKQLRPKQQQVASRVSGSETLASAGVTAWFPAAATTAEDDDMVLLGTLPGSFTAVPGAAGLEVSYGMLATARAANTNADQLMVFTLFILLSEQMHQGEQRYDKGQLQQLQQSVELQKKAEQLIEELQQLQLLVEASMGQLQNSLPFVRQTLHSVPVPVVSNWLEISARP